MVRNRGDQLVLRVPVLVQFGEVDNGLGRDLRVLDNELTEKSLQLRDELRYRTPLRDVLPFESLKLFSVLLHDSLLNHELRVITQELRRPVPEIVHALHVV